MRRFALVLAAGAAAVLGAGCADLPPKTEEQLAGRQIRYVCRDGTEFLAEFDAETRYARLTFRDRQVVLPRRASTDAFVRFGDGQQAFATSGREAVLADQIRITHEGCLAR